MESTSGNYEEIEECPICSKKVEDLWTHFQLCLYKKNLGDEGFVLNEDVMKTPPEKMIAIEPTRVISRKRIEVDNAGKQNTGQSGQALGQGAPSTPMQLFEGGKTEEIARVLRNRPRTFVPLPQLGKVDPAFEDLEGKILLEEKTPKHILKKVLFGDWRNSTAAAIATRSRSSYVQQKSTKTRSKTEPPFQKRFLKESKEEVGVDDIKPIQQQNTRSRRKSTIQPYFTSDDFEAIRTIPPPMPTYPTTKVDLVFESDFKARGKAKAAAEAEKKKATEAKSRPVTPIRLVKISRSKSESNPKTSKQKPNVYAIANAKCNVDLDSGYKYIPPPYLAKLEEAGFLKEATTIDFEYIRGCDKILEKHTAEVETKIGGSKKKGNPTKTLKHSNMKFSGPKETVIYKRAGHKNYYCRHGQPRFACDNCDICEL